MFDTSELVPSKYSPNNEPDWDFLLQDAPMTPSEISLFVAPKDLARSYYSEDPFPIFEEERMMMDTSILWAHTNLQKNHLCMVPIPKINELRKKVQLSIQVSLFYVEIQAIRPLALLDLPWVCTHPIYRVWPHHIV
jgi:hypothetical protein